ncbi:MAG: valine--tRNA ligase [Deltaproteobacteria bacterium]|nr:valine--tRNA ligase [Deltaproteobacteria bacterium]
MSAEATSKHFNHQESEKAIYKMWEDLGIFQAEVDPSKKAFCVVIPPPNVTGILHMGHVLDNVPQDVMTRWHRMRGYSAVWIPGTDHAGIATQNVVKKQLLKEGIKMQDIGREEFLKHVWKFKEKHGSIIIEQLKRLGCSCDWRRERFTMDEGFFKAVLHAFVQLFNKGLIYRGKRMVSWCTVCGTALSDDEVEHSNKSGHLWHLRYPVLDASGKPTEEMMIVATTRPETMLGDTAVAVHPDDERYKSLIGKKVLLPIKNRPIPVVADAFVDPKFGTGVVKVTPAHDPNDYKVGLTHNLPIEVVIGDDGKMTEAAGKPYAGLDRFQARKKVVEDLEALGALEKTEKYSHAVTECYRCNSVLEPKISDQWFVKMKPLAEKAKRVVTDGELSIFPESEKHDYFHWMDSIQDWCISRQLWWGHRIPVYYCGSCQHVMASVETPQKCEKCAGTSLRQDDDVLDTWFSSQLWPYATLGWPNKTKDLEYWFPNNWLMSGRDILFFWDARMIMSALELTGKIPFKSLVLHGLVRDSQGRKLSKSLGNSPDPLELFEKYSTDGVRVAIALNYPMGRQDTRLNEELFKSGQGLVTKLWNATKLLLNHIDDAPIAAGSGAAALEDRWILSRLSETIRIHDEKLSQNELVHACKAVTRFFWDEYCDWYLEIIKPRLRGSGEAKQSALHTALTCQQTLLKLMHPYMPFVTEELWQTLRALKTEGIAAKDEQVIAASAWPKAENFKRDLDAEAQVELMTSLVRGVRDVRHHLNMSPKLELDTRLLFLNAQARERFEAVKAVASSIGFLKNIVEHKEGDATAGYVPLGFNGGIGYVRLPAEIDARDIHSKLSARVEKLAKILVGIEKELSNSAFVANAPAALVAETQEKAREIKESIAKLDEFRKALQ